MQWSSDRNAGFSSANRQQLYLPVVTDPEYHYEAVNVETQQANPQSLYWWMKRLIALRKRHPAFGRGTLQFLQPENRKVLAFVREHEGETILVVANLSRYAQWTELALETWEGRVPVELFGSTAFPRISAAPWPISLGPHSFLWFRLTSDILTDARTGVRAEPPTIRWKGSLTRLLDESDDEVAGVLTTWMQERRWYLGKARTVRAGHLHDVVPLGTKGHDSVLAFVQVEYVEDEPELYALPLTVDVQGDLEAVVFESPHAAIAWLEDGQGGRARLVDGALVPEACETLLAIVSKRRSVSGERFELQGHSDRALRTAAGGSVGSLTAHPQRVEQSNSTAFFDERLVLKLIRTVEGGLNPEVELTRYLSDHGFRNVPPVLGTIDVRDSRSRPRLDATLVMVQAYVANEGNLWVVMRDAAEAYLEAAEAESSPPGLAIDTGLTLLELSRREPPPEAHRLIGASMETARVLGERVGRMHAILAAADPSERDLAPEELTPFIVRSIYQGIRTGVRDSLTLLRSRVGTLSDADRAVAAEVLANTDAVDRRLRRLLETRIGGRRIRVHGDLHLGQVLDTGSDVTIIDLEGEPARSLGERRLRKPALTDLAGLVRSFDYAAHAPLVGVAGTGGRLADAGDLPAWARFWSRWMSVACVAGYREATAGAAFLPPDDDGWSVLLEALLIAKAAYELRYELGSRPDWIGIPLLGFRELLSGP
jgi:maltose alpha-D-glucosyltransferase/alpha-amylase